MRSEKPVPVRTWSASRSSVSSPSLVLDDGAEPGRGVARELVLENSATGMGRLEYQLGLLVQSLGFACRDEAGGWRVWATFE